jgi:hypothetical protein
MNCPDIIRELSAPTDRLDPTDLDRHLAACPRCSAWAARSARLDRIWAATRPAEPSPAAFDTVWAQVVADAETPESVRTLRFPSPIWGVALVGLAAAAALLVAILPPIGGTEVGPAPAVAQVEPIQVEPGQVLFIHLRDDGAKVAYQSRPKAAYRVVVAANDEAEVVAADSDPTGELLFRAGGLQ